MAGGHGFERSTQQKQAPKDPKQQVPAKKK